MGNPVKLGLFHRFQHTSSDWRTPRAKAAVIAYAVALYTLAHSLLFPVVGGNAAMMVVPTVLLVAWFVGAGGGFVTREFTLILTSLRVILHRVHVLPDWRAQRELGFLATEAIGTIVGRLLDLNSRSRDELGLRKLAGQRLERRVQVRTAELSGGIS